MAYTKTLWKNREVQNPRTFTQQNNAGGTITLIPAEGTVIEPGTPIIADNMNKIEQGIEDAHAAVDSLSVGSSAVRYAAASGTANTYAITLNPAPTVYTEGMGVAVKINIANTGASTINVNGLGAKSILKANGNALASGNLKVNSVYTLRYNGTSFILQGEGGGGNAQTSDVRVGKSFTNDDGEQVGALDPSPIKSIQRGFVLLAGGVLTANPSISAVDLSKSILRVIPRGNGSSPMNESHARGSFSSSSQLLITRGASANSLGVEWEVIEFNNVKSLQRGQVTTSTNNTAVPITAVDINKSLEFISYSTEIANNSQHELGGQLTTPTNLQLTAHSATAPAYTVEWQVVEFF